MKSDTKSNAQKLRQKWSEALRWAHRRVPTGIRTVIGIMLIVGGALGFLPVLGFWMVPLGMAVIAIDFKVLRKQFRRSWRKRHTSERDKATGGRVEHEK